jgi:hypothetical protein
MSNEPSDLNEARDMLHEARTAFDAFIELLNGEQPLNQEGLYYLLRPLSDTLHQVEERLDLMAH